MTMLEAAACSFQIEAVWDLTGCGLSCIGAPPLIRDLRTADLSILARRVLRCPLNPGGADVMLEEARKLWRKINCYTSRPPESPDQAYSTEGTWIAVSTTPAQIADT